MDNAIYRIIDANFNRSREALRMMEEYVRFSLNRPDFSGRAKQMRHRLCGAFETLDADRLLCSRDTSGDVGRELRVKQQLCRGSLADCFTAAAKRASEALRVLAECLQSIDANAAATMEQLRFEAYALEKDVAMAADAKRRFEPVRLYVLINAIAQTDPREVLERARICCENGADCLQLRAKELCDGPLLELAQRFTSLCRQAGVVSIINDRVDIAVLSDADGVHLGQDEMPVCCARQLAKRPLIVGVSTHNLDELTKAIEAGCDYVGLGPAFDSPTKPDLEVAGPAYIEQALPVLAEAGLPHVAIGGIDLQNIPALLEIGVRAVAVSSAISADDDPAESCKALKNTLLSGAK